MDRVGAMISTSAGELSTQLLTLKLVAVRTINFQIYNGNNVAHMLKCIKFANTPKNVQIIVVRQRWTILCMFKSDIPSSKFLLSIQILHISSMIIPLSTGRPDKSQSSIIVHLFCSGTFHISYILALLHLYYHSVTTMLLVTIIF